MTKRKNFTGKSLDPDDWKAAEDGDQGDSTDGPLPEMVGGNTEGTTADEEHGLVEPSYCKISDVKLGDSLTVLGDEVDCMHDGETKEVKQNANGRLYVECEEGKHYLDRVTDMHDYVLGLGVKPAKTV